MINKRFFQKSFSSFSFILLFLVSAWSIHAQTTVDLTVNGTWTVPCGVTSITVETWGAGGGGGLGEGKATGGGGGGAYAKKVFTVNTGDSFAYQIGAGGSGNGSNYDGGDTWFASASTLMAKGGKGVTKNNVNGAAGGLATESIGTVTYSGGKGGTSTANWVSAWTSGGGGGAARATGNGGDASDPDAGTSTAPGGAGGQGYNRLTIGPGRAGNNYGGGGSGTRPIGTQNGGAGAQGFIRITYTAATGTQAAISAPTSISTNPITGILGCTTNQVTLQALGGNTGIGASTLWYTGTNCPNLGYIQEFMGDTYVLNNATQGNVVNGNRTFTATTNDPSIDFQNILSSTFNPALHKYVVIRYRVVSGTAGNTEIYFKKGTNPIGESYVVRASLNSDNQWHILTINMSNSANWNNTGGNITGFRYDFATANAVVMEIDYLVLSSQPILENTNADDSQLSLGLSQVDTATKAFGVLRVADQAALCNNTVPSTTCISTNIERKDKTFNGSSGGNWSAGANWIPVGSPAADHCVYINQGHVIVNQNTAKAKSIHVGAAGKVTINEKMALTVTDEIINHGTGANFVVQNNGNLIQVNNAVNTGNITVENEFNFSVDREQFNYVISPVFNQNLTSIFQGNPTTTVYHSENTNFFYSSSGAYLEGRALAVKEPKTGPNTQTAKYVGVPNNGNLNYKLAYTTTKPNVNHGWNLVGNPYPSNLDLIAFYNLNVDKIDADIKFWDNRANSIFKQEGSTYGGSSYALFNAATFVGVAAPSSKDEPDLKMPDGYAKVGLGFMVSALATANAENLRFENTMRTVNEAIDFHGRQAAMQADRFWLTLKTPSGLKVMNAVSYFSRGTDGISRDDSKSSDASDDLYTIVDDTKLVIQGKTPFTDTDVLSLGFNAFKEGNYTMHLHKKQGVFDNGQSIYLKDNQLGIITDLTSDSYSFMTQPGDTEGRFEIIYRPEGTLATSNAIKSKLEIYKDAGDFVVRSSENINQLEVYDPSGRLVYTAKPKNKEYRIPGHVLVNGMYVIKAIQTSGNTVKRIIK